MTEEKENTDECRATELLKEGRRHFICREFAQSVEKLSEACELLVEKYGEGNVVLADAFYSYGEALLEMARMETPVLGNALKDVPDVIAESDDKMEATEEPDESLNDEMKEEIADKVIEALCEAPVVENSNKSEDKNSDKQTEDEEKDKVKESDKVNRSDETTDASVNDNKSEDEAETEDKDDEKENEAMEDDDEAAEAGEGEDVEDEDGDEEDAEETEGDEAATGNDEENEVGNLQLAWEIIEVARTLYEKKATAENEACIKSKLRIADCHRKLGEVMLERDEWIPAAEELQKCLEIEKTCVDLPNRRVAETYFEIGVAFDNAEKLQESAEAFQKSAECLQDCQKKLQDKADKSSDDEAEIKELDLVLEEIKTRITEVKQKKANQPEPLGDGGASSSSGVTTNGFGAGSSDLNGATTVNGFGHSAENGNGTKETQDISHLIRKRPKDSDVTESPVKKVRVEPAGDVPEVVPATSD